MFGKAVAVGLIAVWSRILLSVFSAPARDYPAAIATAPARQLRPIRSGGSHAENDGLNYLAILPTLLMDDGKHDILNPHQRQILRETVMERVKPQPPKHAPKKNCSDGDGYVQQKYYILVIDDKKLQNHQSKGHKAGNPKKAAKPLSAYHANEEWLNYVANLPYTTNLNDLKLITYKEPGTPQSHSQRSELESARHQQQVHQQHQQKLHQQRQQLQANREQGQHQQRQHQQHKQQQKHHKQTNEDKDDLQQLNNIQEIDNKLVDFHHYLEQLALYQQAYANELYQQKTQGNAITHQQIENQHKDNQQRQLYAAEHKQEEQRKASKESEQHGDFEKGADILNPEDIYNFYNQLKQLQLENKKTFPQEHAVNLEDSGKRGHANVIAQEDEDQVVHIIPARSVTQKPYRRHGSGGEKKSKKQINDREVEDNPKSTVAPADDDDQNLNTLVLGSNYFKNL